MPRPSVRAPPRLDSEAPVWREAHPALLSTRQECLSRLLSPCGPVQSVELQEKPELSESPKEPPSKFFHPKPVPVSLQDPAAPVRVWAGPERRPRRVGERGIRGGRGTSGVACGQARPDLCGLGGLSAERPPPGFATAWSFPSGSFHLS